MIKTAELAAATPHHYSAILALNEQAVPHVNSIGVSELRDLADQAFYFKVAMHDDQVIGFLLTLAEGAQYESLNYRWFSESYPRFVYVDRIVISPDHAGLGIGKQLYNDLYGHALNHAQLVGCEVNLKPANPNSLAFHKKQGFEEVGQQETENGQKVVCLMTKAIGTE